MKSWAKSMISNDAQPSEAYYYSIVNIEDGVILADSTMSPREATTCGNPEPDLQTWSDVMFLQWQELFATSRSTSSISNLNYIIRHNVINDDTVDYVLKALNKPADFDDWSQIKDGVTWYPHDDEFKAILTRPNCRGGFWFLVRHKPQLGIKRITEITVQGIQDETTWDGTTEISWLLDIILKIESVS